MVLAHTLGDSRRAVLVAGAVSAFLVALGSVADICLGVITGSGAALLHLGAAARLEALAAAPLLGLYGLDLLNLLTTLLMLPATYAAVVLLKEEGSRGGDLAFALAILGAGTFVALNPALPMLGLSWRYAAETGPEGRGALAAAAEALMARGGHGSPGALPAFALPLLANLLLSASLLGSSLVPRALAWLGLGTNVLLLGYLALVTFLPGALGVATAMAAPGGLAAIAWLILLGLSLLKAARIRREATR